MIWFAAAVLAQGQASGSVDFQDGKGFFVLRNFGRDGVTVDFVKQEVLFRGNAKPLIVEQRDQGLRLEANFMDGIAQKGDKGYIPTRFKATGDVFLLQDTIDADSFLTGKGLPTITRKASSRFELRTNELLYRREGQLGTATVPGAFQLASYEVGATKTIFHYDQRWTATGASGNVILEFDATGKMKLNSSEFFGPVKIVLNRTEMLTSVAPPTQSSLTTTAQRVKLVRTAAGYDLTASGSVQVVGTGAYDIKVDGDSALLRLDAELRPLTASVSGGPAKTTVRAGGGR